MRALFLGLAAAAALALSVPAHASEERPTQSELEAELICPTCRTTLDQSNAPVAQQMKRVIAERIAAGDTKSEIKDKLVAAYGPGVLAAPEKKGFGLLAWVVPLVLLFGGAIVVAVLLWTWTKRPDDEPMLGS